MVKQKITIEEALISNEDLAGTFSFIRVSDGYGGSSKELVFTLHIKNASGTNDTGKVVVKDALTAQERSELNPLLVKLRDAVLTAKGYIDV